MIRWAAMASDHLRPERHDAAEGARTRRRRRGESAPTLERVLVRSVILAAYRAAGPAWTRLRARRSGLDAVAFPFRSKPLGDCGEEPARRAAESHHVGHAARRHGGRRAHGPHAGGGHPGDAGRDSGRPRWSGRARPSLGQDAGTLAGLGPIGVPITDDALEAFVGADGVLDFTTPGRHVAFRRAGRPGPHRPCRRHDGPRRRRPRQARGGRRAMRRSSAPAT